MRARIGFVLFLFVFVVAAIVVPMVGRTSFLLQRAMQYVSAISGQLIQTARLLAKKVGTVEWKSFIQRAS